MEEIVKRRRVPVLPGSLRFVIGLLAAFGTLKLTYVLAHDIYEWLRVIIAVAAGYGITGALRAWRRDATEDD